MSNIVKEGNTFKHWTSLDSHELEANLRSENTSVEFHLTLVRRKIKKDYTNRLGEIINQYLNKVLKEQIQEIVDFCTKSQRIF